MGETDISSQRTDARKALETLAAIGNWLVDIPEGRTHITKKDMLNIKLQ